MSIDGLSNAQRVQAFQRAEPQVLCKWVGVDDSDDETITLLCDACHLESSNVFRRAVFFHNLLRQGLHGHEIYEACKTKAHGDLQLFINQVIESGVKKKCKCVLDGSRCLIVL